MRERCRCLFIAAVVAGGCQPRAPADDVMLRVTVDSLLPRLIRLTGLEQRGELRMEVQDRAAVRRFVEGRLAEELPVEELEGVRATYGLLGLIPDTLDLRALLLDLYTEQVLGYYDPASETLFVVRGVDRDAVRTVLIHELVHALQDQHANLDSLIARDLGNDRQTAAHAALEGHATLVMFAFLAEEATGRLIAPASVPNPAVELAPALEAQNQEFPVFRRAPAIVRETLLFPYVAGSSFVHAIWQRTPTGGMPPAPLDSLLPQSTEQVLHPERLLDRRDDPVEISFTDPPPAGWQLLRDNTMGELETGLLLATHGGGAARREAAVGWDGDRFRLLRNERNERAFVWVTAWDDAAAARRFRLAADSALAGLDGRHRQSSAIVVAGQPGVRVIVTEGTVDPGIVTMGFVAQ